MSDKSLDGKTALITGGNKGLGKAMALALGAAGARIILVARHQAQLDSAAEEVGKTGARVDVFASDVTDEGAVTGLESAVSQRCGKVQILINNAGINNRKNLVDFTLEEWRRMMDTNLNAPFLMCRAFVPHMLGQGYGRIINLTSIMSHISLPGRTAYSASKTGLLGLTRALALELVQEKITVNGISPGPFATEMNQPIIQNPELNAQFVAKIPAGRWGRLEEVGQLAVYLCSEAASFITGTDILIDGGWTAQ